MFKFRHQLKSLILLKQTKSLLCQTAIQQHIQNASRTSGMQAQMNFLIRFRILMILSPSGLMSRNQRLKKRNKKIQFPLQTIRGQCSQLLWLRAKSLMLRHLYRINLNPLFQHATQLQDLVALKMLKQQLLQRLQKT